MRAEPTNSTSMCAPTRCGRGSNCPSTLTFAPSVQCADTGG